MPVFVGERLGVYGGMEISARHITNRALMSTDSKPSSQSERVQGFCKGRGGQHIDDVLPRVTHDSSTMKDNLVWGLQFHSRENGSLEAERQLGSSA